MRLRKFKNECYLGNPSFPSECSDIGSADVWEPVSSISTKTDKIRKYKYKNKKVKMKNLNDKKILNKLVEKYTADGVILAINRLFENDEIFNNSYMIQSLIDDGYLDENATKEEIEDFINDRCMIFWADDRSELAMQYVDQMINYKEYDTLADFIKRFNCLDYEAIGIDYKLNLDATDDEDDYELDHEMLSMDDYEAGQFVLDNFYNNDLEEMIKQVSKRIHFSSYIDFDEAGENMLNLFDYTEGNDHRNNHFYILIFY